MREKSEGLRDEHCERNPKDYEMSDAREIWSNARKNNYKGKHMKIIKKVKWALVSVWIFIVLIMLVGTIVIGRSYLSVW